MTLSPENGPTVAAANPENGAVRRRPVTEEAAGVPGRDVVAANAAGQPQHGDDNRLCLKKRTDVRAARVLDRHVGRVPSDVSGKIVGLDDVERFEIVPAVHVETELEPRAAECLLRAALDMEVVRRHVGALDAAARGRRRESILIRALVERAEKAGEGDLLEAAQVPEVVRGCEAVRILVRIVEPHRLRVVAGTLDIPAVVALPPRRQQAGANLMIAPNHEPAVLPSRIEDVAVVFRTAPVVRATRVTLDEDAALGKALGDLYRAASIRRAGSEHRVAADPQRTAGLGIPRAHGNDAAKGVGPIRHRSGSARDVDAFE